MVHIDGFTAPNFSKVRDVFVKNFDDDLELGAGFAAYIEDELVIEIWGGYSDRAKAKIWQQDTMVPVFSVTKPVAALVAAMLVDRGQLDYDEPVHILWPEFSAHGKGDLTLAQMLSHQAGLPGFVDPIDPDLWFDPPALAVKLAQMEPLWMPGTAQGYHPLTYGYLIGEMVYRAAGISLGQILRQEICAPLGIDFWIGTPATEHDRIADMERPNTMAYLGGLTDIKKAAFLRPWSAPNRGGAIWREVEIPAANGHGTASALARLYGIFANEGKIGEQTLISKSTYQALTQSRICGPNLVLPYELDFAAGVMRNNNLVFGPNPDTLCHSGWGGAVGLGDPKTGLSAAYVMNKQSNQLLGDARAKGLIDALYACL